MAYCPGLPAISFLGLCVLTGVAARNVDRELGELVGALAVDCHALIARQREDLCTVGLEMAHIGLHP